MRRAFACVLMALCVAASLPSTAEAESSVDDVVRARVEAVKARNEAAFMATVDPEAPADFVESQRNWIRSAGNVRVTDLAIDVRTDVDPAAQLDLGDGSKLLETVTSYRIDGYDDRPFVVSEWLTYRQHDGGYVLSSASDGELLGLVSQVDVLATAPMEALRSFNFVVMARPDRLDRARELLWLAESARGRVLLDGITWSSRVPIALLDDARQATRVLDTRADATNFVAFVSYRLLREEGGVGAARMYVQDANLSRSSEQAQRDTLVHEMTHAALSARTTPITPVWLQEGVAEWVRLGKPVSRVPPVAGATLPADSQFTGDELQVAYGRSASAIAFMAHRHGPAAPTRLFSEITKRSDDAGTPAYNVDAAFRAATGESLEAFTAAWRGPQVA